MEIQHSRSVSAGDAVVNPAVLLVAGEASGDLHGSNLVEALKRLRPETEFLGIGGPRMKEAGVRIVASSSDTAVVGLTEVVRKIPKILSALRTVKETITRRRPSLVILIDFPDFNLLVAKHARRAGVPVLYFISPQVWAWRKGRVRTIARRVDTMAVILPFERDFYLGHGIAVAYVGHPLLDVCPPVGSRVQAARRMGVGTGGPVIGLLPGSRTDEIRNLMPAMVGSVRLLLRRYPSLRCVIPLAPTVEEEFVKSFVPGDLPIEIHRNDIYTLLNACDAAVVASGTATLEAALMETPMVIVYKVSALTYRLGRMVIRAQTIGLANLVAGGEYFPELIQHEVTPARVCAEVVSMLEDPAVRSRLRRALSSVRKRLGDKGASERTAALAAAMMEGAEGGVRIGQADSVNGG